MKKEIVEEIDIFLYDKDNMFWQTFCKVFISRI